jgi:hypothetical protein
VLCFGISKISISKFWKILLSRKLGNIVLDEKETPAHMKVLRDALPNGSLDNVNRLEVEAPCGGYCEDSDGVAQRVAAGQDHRDLLQHVLEQVDALVDVPVADLGPDELHRAWDRCTVCVDMRLALYMKMLQDSLDTDFKNGGIGRLRNAH